MSNKKVTEENRILTEMLEMAQALQGRLFQGGLQANQVVTFLHQGQKMQALGACGGSNAQPGIGTA